MPIEPAAENEVLSEIAEVIRSQARAVGLQVPEFFARYTRQALDEVIDGPRTGRWIINQLSKTEKTYIGTKVEILIRSALGAASGTRTDCLINDVETDIKWSKEDAAWMIGPENIGELCLGICTNSDQTTFSVGLFVPYRHRLRGRENRDKKLSLTAAAREEHVLWLVRNEAFPQNFVALLEPSVRDHVMAGASSQERIRRLAEALPMQLIPRQALQTVAMRPDGDPIRRTRQDSYNATGLEGVHLLSTKQKGREVRQVLGLQPDAHLPKDHWLSVPAEIYFRVLGRPETLELAGGD